METETFALYSNFGVTGGSAAKYEGQVRAASSAPLKLNPAKIAKVQAECDRVAALCGWRA